ncbi:hypothetical protein BI330_01990 [Mycobacterium sp. CBMA 623]|nr:hypothetical protein [Mycobacteroides sp. CBMA 326]
MPVGSLGEVREFLRSLPVFSGAISEFDVNDVPPEPEALFERWLREAVDAGVPEPHAMTLSTVDAECIPDARTLILKDIDADGWWFSSNARSVKGAQLSVHPRAALSFYWPEVARQVRVRGAVRPGSLDRSAADFRARGPGAKAVSLASHESQPLPDRATCEVAVAEADKRLADNPELVSPDWQVYAVDATSVEFWQADKDRQHARVQYRRHNSGWQHTLLWP